jgi:PKHD-type hydroxylase
MSNKIDYKSSAAWAFKSEHRQRWAYWDDAFTPQECDMIISDCNVYKLMRAKTLGNTDSDIRDSDVTWINPEQNFEWMYRRITDIATNLNERFFGFDLWGFGESLQFTRYQAPAGKYDSHVDCTNGGVIRKLSLTVQLTDPSEYEGGDFEFIDQTTPEKLSRKRGTVLVFPSFSLHRVTPVTQGVRHSLVGWITGPAFK